MMVLEVNFEVLRETDWRSPVTARCGRDDRSSKKVVLVGAVNESKRR